MRIFQSVLELIGKTPLLEVHNIELSQRLQARVLVKLEYFNPAGSVKDRAALSMIEDAEERGLLTKGTVIIEPTSGNTGIGLAAVAASKGYRTIFTMPETMSVERQKILRGYGAEIVLTDGKAGMSGAIKKAEALCKEMQPSVLLGQFDNEANAKAHERTTGPEIWEDTDGNIDVFVAGVGSGGTISGAGRYLKSKQKELLSVAVEPAGSPVLSGGTPGAHGLMGIGAGFLPKILDHNSYDRILRITEQEAYDAARLLATEEGILVGISSGAAFAAALQLALKEQYAGKVIVVILPDTGERYLSTPLFQ